MPLALSAHSRRDLRQEPQKMFIRFVDLKVVSHQILFVREHISARDTKQRLSAGVLWQDFVTCW